MTADVELSISEAAVKAKYAELEMARNAAKLAYEAWDEARIRYWNLVQEKTREMCGHDQQLVPGYLKQGFGP